MMDNPFIGDLIKDKIRDQLVTIATKYGKIALGIL